MVRETSFANLKVESIRLAGSGKVATGTQHAHIADAGDTTADPSVVGSSQAAAATSAQIAGGESPTEAEHNALQADYALLRGKYNQAQTDIVNLRASVATLETDMDSLITKFNLTLDALEAFKIDAAS